MKKYETRWFICEYVGAGEWQKISEGYYDAIRAKEECHKLFEKRGGAYSKLPSISVFSDKVEIEC